MAFKYMKDKDGQVITVNDDAIDKYTQQGYTVDLKKALDKSKLSANSVYRDENKNLIGSNYKMPKQTFTDGTTKGNIQSVAQQTPTQSLRQAIQSPKVTNNTNTIKDAYANDLTSIVSKIKEAIAKGTQGQNQIIQDAPSQFQPLKNQSEVNRMRGLDTLRETIANRGDRGGIGRSELLQTDIAGQNQLNSIEQQQQKVISDANTTIQNLEEQGRFQEAQATADNASQMLQAIVQENNRVESETYNRLRDAVSDTRYDENRSESALDRLKQDFIANITQFAGNYQAKINEVKNDGDTSNDWQLDPLQAARQGKLTDANSQYQQQGYVSEDIAQALGKPVGTMTEAYKQQVSSAQATAQAKADATTYDRAWQQFEKLGYVTADIAQILGLPVNTTTAAYKKIQYDLNKPYYAPKSSGSNGLTPNQNLTQENQSLVAELTNDIFNRGSAEESLGILRQNKAEILQNLINAGYNGKEALEYWNLMIENSGG